MLLATLALPISAFPGTVLTINLGSQPEYHGQHLRPPNPNTSSSSSNKGRSTDGSALSSPGDHCWFCGPNWYPRVRWYHWHAGGMNKLYQWAFHSVQLFPWCEYSLMTTKDCLSLSIHSFKFMPVGFIPLRTDQRNLLLNHEWCHNGQR